MIKFYKATLAIMMACGMLVSCGEDEGAGCEDYTGPALTKNNHGSGCWFIDSAGATVSYTDPERCKCAK